MVRHLRPRIAPCSSNERIRRSTVQRATEDAKVTEHDELDPIWKSFRDEVAKLDAA